MTPAETARLLEHVTRRWPRAQLPADTGDVWLADLADIHWTDAVTAVDRWARAGHEFPPTSGWVLADVERHAQAEPPGFDEMQDWISRHARLLHYGSRCTAEQTAQTLARLEAAGAHEAVLRFVAAHGVYAARMLPDPSWQPLDVGQLADRRDAARDYQHRILPAWQADPRPGAALERICRAAGLNADELRHLAGGRRHRELERAATARRALPAGDPVKDDPMVDFDPRQLMAEMRAERVRTAAESKERLLARRREEGEARRAALAELAEHAGARAGAGDAR